MCSTCFNRFSKSINSFFHIQINIDQWCYTKIIYKVYLNFPSRNKIFLTLNKPFHIYYNEQILNMT